MTTTDASAREALLTAMRQYINVLDTAVSLPSKDDMAPPLRDTFECANEPDEIFWLESHAIETVVDVEAVELLMLLASVDFALWKQFTRELWSEETEWFDFFDTRTALRIGVCVHLFDEDREVLPFNEFIVGALTSARSATYQRTYELMERVHGKPLQSLPVVPVMLYFMVSADGRSERRSHVRLLEDSEDEEEEQQRHYDAGGGERHARSPEGQVADRELLVLESDSEDSDHHNALFLLLRAVYKVLRRQPTDAASAMRVTHLDLSHTSFPMDETVVHLLERIRKLDVQVVGIPTICVDVQGQALHDGLRSFRSLLDVTEQSQSAVIPGVDTFNIPNLGAHLASSRLRARDLVPSVFSAIQASHSLRRMSIDFEIGTDMRGYGGTARHRMVWWATYALFFRPPLETVDINAAALRIQDVEWMAQMWHAVNPLALLFPEERVSIDTAVAPRAYLKLPVTGKPISASKVWEESSPATFQILGKPCEGFLPVLLPGWGQAWVKHEKDTIVPTRPLHPTTFQSPTHLIFRQPASYDTTLALVRLVGRDVKYLSVSGDDLLASPLTPFFTSGILSACPRLKELRLSGSTDVQAIIDAIRTGQSTDLQQISVHSSHIHDDGADMRLFEALSNPRDAVSKQLRNVRLYSSVGSNRATLEAALQMLRSNRYLREVGLSFHCDQELVDEFQPQFLPFRLSRAREPLPSRCLLAFLSAVRSGVPRNSTNEAPEQYWQALEQFDSRILSLVVGFAASPRTRTAWFRLFSQRH